MKWKHMFPILMGYEVSLPQEKKTKWLRNTSNLLITVQVLNMTNK